jgi:hypothetical protein
MKELILEIINKNQALTSVELVKKVMTEVNPVKFELQVYRRELEELHREFKIKVMEVNPPHDSSPYNRLPYNVYFPAGTVTVWR